MGEWKMGGYVEWSPLPPDWLAEYIAKLEALKPSQTRYVVRLERGRMFLYKTGEEGREVADPRLWLPGAPERVVQTVNWQHPEILVFTTEDPDAQYARPYVYAPEGGGVKAPLVLLGSRGHMITTLTRAQTERIALWGRSGTASRVLVLR